jgi:hypothetical protein
MIIAWVNTGNLFADIVARFGAMLTFYIIVIFYGIIFGFMKISWNCGVCGKPNTTNMIKFILQFCDHQGNM